MSKGVCLATGGWHFRFSIELGLRPNGVALRLSQVPHYIDRAVTTGGWHLCFSLEVSLRPNGEALRLSQVPHYIDRVVIGGVVWFRRFRRRGHIGGGVDRAHCAPLLHGEGCRITRNMEVAMWPLVLAAPQE